LFTRGRFKKRRKKDGDELADTARQNEQMPDALIVRIRSSKM
jgi:hypothetical protein